MDTALEAILIDTYNQDYNRRLNAENSLKQFLNTPGSLSGLLLCIAKKDVHREIRQATGILIKNRLRDYWEVKSKKCLPSTPEEREQLKHGIVEVLLNEYDTSLRGILAEAVRVVSEYDFPDNWPALIPTLVGNLQSGDVLKLFNSLTALRKIIKRFEFKDEKERGPLNDTLQVLFPLLQGLITSIIAQNLLEVAQVLKLCLKIFYSSVVYKLPKVTSADVNLWFRIIGEIIQKPLPEAEEGLEPTGQPKDPDERKMWPWWKLKKWATRILTHILQKYGNPKYSSEENIPFAEFFKNNTAAMFIPAVMLNLQWKASGKFLTEDVHRQCLTYLVGCAEMSPTYKIIKPHMHFLLFDIIFPTLCLTREEAATFDSDPHEFIRKVQDPKNDWLSPTVAAINLLQMLARYRKADTLPVFLPFLQTILQEYEATPPDRRDYLRKDGVLVALSALIKIMCDSKDYKGFALPILITHIIPEFKSPVAFLRARACWAMEFFCVIDWTSEATIDMSITSSTTSSTAKNNKKKAIKVALKGGKKTSSNSKVTAGEALKSVLEGLITCLRDPTLPVQAAAAVALRCLISEEGATDLLRPLLSHIVGEYFRIMEEVGSESVISALETIIEEYGDQIADIAVVIVVQLVKCFHEYAADIDEEEAQYNAAQCLETINSTLEAIEEHQGIILQLEPVLHPLILSVLAANENNSFEYLDNVVHFVAIFTYNSPQGITPTMWTICGPLMQALHDWAIDYLTEFLSPLLNYMTKDIASFVGGSTQRDNKPFVLLLLEIVAKAFDTEESYSGKDFSAGATLLSCLVTSAAIGQVDIHAILPQIMGMALNRTQNVRSIMVKTRLLEVFLACLYYDAPFVMMVVIQQPPFTMEIATSAFAMLFNNLKDMSSDFAHRLIVLSFTNLLKVLPQLTAAAGNGGAVIPQVVIENTGAMFRQILRELVLIEEAAANPGNEDDDDEDADEDDYENGDMEDEDEDIDDDEVDEDGEELFDDKDPNQAAANRAKKLYVPEDGYNEDQDCVNVEDEQYREALEQMDRQERVKRELYRAGERVMDDDELAEEFEYTSLIETYDVTVLFFDDMQVLMSQQAPYVAQLQAGLDGEDQQHLQRLYAMWQERKQIASQKQAS